MNRVFFLGRLTRDPEMRYGGANNTAIARFSLAVNRRFKREGQPEADFFNCTAFGRQAEFVERYLKKGTKIILEGEIQNDNYTNKEGQMVYSVQVIANNIEFAESKNASGGGFGPSDGGGFAPAGGGFAPAAGNGGYSPAGGSGSNDSSTDFMSIDDGIQDEGIPF